jgi:Fic family protein
MAQQEGFVWQRKSWPSWSWSAERVLVPLSRARLAQGAFLGKASSLGFDRDASARADILVEDAVHTAAIEGERLASESVRSSVARRLGLSTSGLPRAPRNVEGLVEMIFDATTRFDQPLTAERIKGWQAALFPTGFSGMHRVRVGDWRREASPMQVVSGPLGREKVHFEAPPAEKLDIEMDRFLAWWVQSQEVLDGLLRAALAHIWFVTIHPFDDGNGRIARALGDMALAQDEHMAVRLYSTSAQINAERDAYYDVLERTQRGHGDVTDWLVWFLECFARALAASELVLARVLDKAKFWQKNGGVELTGRQRKVLNRLLDAGREEFECGLTTRKYVGMTKASRATAQREIADLLEKGLLRKRSSGGRSTSYELV